MQIDFQFSDSAPVQEKKKNKKAMVESEEPKLFTVSALTRLVRELIENRIGEIWVEGEISNYRKQASGHHYFTIKDEGSQLSCVLFAGNARNLNHATLADGKQVQLFGELTVYETRGQYQLIVQRVQTKGAGALQARFEALKIKLAAEGLFDAARKRSLPVFPRKIGIVTSPTGAAIHDFLHVITRRMPGIEVVIYPVRVQGRGAAQEIAAAVNAFSNAPQSGVPRVDVIVVSRGGGSLEDLWEFNEEIVARAVASARIPVVSAVGHEIDFTICDFAADCRAPTPSAAAEILVPVAADILQQVYRQRARMSRVCVEQVRFLTTCLRTLQRTALFREPVRILREKRQEIDQLLEEIEFFVNDHMQRSQKDLAHAREVLRARQPMVLLSMLKERVAQSLQHLTNSIQQGCAEKRTQLKNACNLLTALSPQSILQRGYTLTFREDGSLVRTKEESAKGDRLVIRFAEGKIGVIVDRL